MYFINFLRLPLPNLRFLPTQRAKWNQSITLNPNQWKNKKGLKKIISKLYNQTFLSVDNEQKRQGNNFNLNPFALDDNTQISLLYNIRNSLYFNRNIQNYSTVYTFINSRAKQQLIIGSQENKNRVHQIEFEHKFSKFWLLRFFNQLHENELVTENFTNNFTKNRYKTKIFCIQKRNSFIYGNSSGK